MRSIVSFANEIRKASISKDVLILTETLQKDLTRAETKVSVSNVWKNAGKVRTEKIRWQARKDYKHTGEQLREVEKRRCVVRKKMCGVIRKTNEQSKDKCKTYKELVQNTLNILKCQ